MYTDYRRFVGASAEHITTACTACRRRPLWSLIISQVIDCDELHVCAAKQSTFAKELIDMDAWKASAPLNQWPSHRLTLTYRPEEKNYRVYPPHISPSAAPERRLAFSLYRIVDKSYQIVCKACRDFLASNSSDKCSRAAALNTMLSHDTSCVEYFMPTYGILVLVSSSKIDKGYGYFCQNQR